MIYADYEFYKNEYCCGKKAVIDTASFTFYVRKSSQIIKAHTFDNIKEEIPECVKMCACEIAELLYKFDNINSDNGIISESVGDMSRTYKSGEVRNQNLNRGIQSVIKAWLNDTGLLYRGAYD